MTGKGLRLYKREKLCSVTAIDRLFAARLAKGMTAVDDWGQIGVALCYPLKMVFGQNPNRGGANVRFLISVPKKRLRRAVDRVTMRRRIRESYRLERGRIESLPECASDKNWDIAFIYVANELVDSDRVRTAMNHLLSRNIYLRPEPTNEPELMK